MGWRSTTALGRCCFVEANDTLRILGKYPDATPDTALPSKAPDGVASSAPRINGGGPVPSNPVRPRPWKPRKNTTILRWRPCRLAHPLILLRPTISLRCSHLPSFVIVGLKPSPRTWFRRHRESSNDTLSGSSQWRGCLAWFPSVDARMNQRPARHKRCHYRSNHHVAAAQASIVR